MASFLMFCEARADFETTWGLVERVLREEGPEWVRDLLASEPEVARSVLTWVPDEDRGFFDLHHAKDIALRRRLRIPHDRFKGQRGAYGALNAYTAFLVARDIARNTTIDAVLYIWDMDDQGEERRIALARARKEAMGVVPFKILLGAPDRMREAWVLAGFDPETRDERATLEAERRALGFCPCRDADQLDAKDENATRSPKRVLNALTGGNRDREAFCWTTASLETLRARGTRSGLTTFLDETANTLLPLFCDGNPRPTARTAWDALSEDEFP